ncbi:Flp pilus assembly protein CpaB [Cytobacillus sp. FJAT-54145]|uniref:Flp pilus assembly protein CpaB n=1 Tax=Cytobacillus spartinae TaxID=3299023 RepID=A0ABW6KAP0_9BACI
MNKKKSSLLTLPMLLVLALGVVVATSVYGLLKSTTVDIMVAKQDIEARTKVDPSLFITKSVNEDHLPTGAILATEKDKLQDKVTNSKIIAGVPMVEAQFYGKAEKSVLTSVVSDNNVVITVQADQITGVSNDLSDVDRVNVYATVETDAIGVATALIEQNAPVRAVAKDEKGMLQGVSIEVEPDVASELAFAVQSGALHLAVVPREYQDITSKGVTGLGFVRKWIDTADIPVVDPNTPVTANSNTEQQAPK